MSSPSYYQAVDDTTTSQHRQQEEQDHQSQQPLEMLSNDNDHKVSMLADSSSLEMTVDEAIERLGMGRFQRKILWAAGLCFAADSMEILLLSFLSHVLQYEWNLTNAETATITSVVFAGAMTGTLILGPLGDHWGRRPMFFMAALIITVFGMATALARHFVDLIFLRFFVGFGVGGLTVPFDTLAEFLPREARGTNLLKIEYFWAFGTLLVPLVAYVTIGEWNSWRWFVLFCSIPCLLSTLLAALVVPESPHWLCVKGKTDQALHILRKASLQNHGNTDIYPEGTTLIVPPAAQEEAKIWDLLSKKWRGLTLKLWAVWLGYAFGYYGVILVITRVFDEQEEDGPYNFDYAAIFQSGAGELLGTAMVVLTVDRLGRIPSQVVAYTLGGVCIFLLSYLAENEGWHLVLLGFLSRTFLMAGSCVAWVSTAELLTTEIRTSGHAAANAVARVGGFVAPFVVQQDLSLKVIGCIMLTTQLWTAFFAWRLPETKGKDMGSAVEEEEENHKNCIPEIT